MQKMIFVKIHIDVSCALRGPRWTIIRSVDQRTRSKDARAGDQPTNIEGVFFSITTRLEPDESITWSWL